MSSKQLTEIDTDWTEAIKRLRVELDSVHRRLINLESELAEKLLAINEFEFTLRVRVKPLLSRLEALDVEIADYLNQLQRNAPGESDDGWTAWSTDEGGAAAAGDYRYREPAAPVPPPNLDRDQKAELKRLYRQLARRFHPDFAADDAERHYRTHLMTAINAAYRAGDLDRLNELALEPDLTSTLDYAQTDRQMAEALSLEIERCQRRINEIAQELDTLMNHESARLMRKAAQTEAAGRDFFHEIADQLRQKIRQRQVERDALKGEVESTAESEGLRGDAFADAMWDISLDQAYEEGAESEFTEWFMRRSGRRFDDDDILDDSD